MKNIFLICFFVIICSLIVYAITNDSDNGIDPFTFGICSQEINGTNQTNPDWCTGGWQGGNLIEWYVENDTCKNMIIDCSNYNYFNNKTNSSHTFSCRFGKCIEKIGMQI